MKKILVILLALSVLMSMTGTAFADLKGRYNDFSKLKGGAKINGDVFKLILFENGSQAITGDANAVGNASLTTAMSASEAKAYDGDNGSGADNLSTNIVANNGIGDSRSGPVDALNAPDNTVDSAITELAEAASGCDIYTAAEGVYVDTAGGGHDAGLCDCCPAEAKGDIVGLVFFENSAYAMTGDANAVGNAAKTVVVFDDKASAANGARAANTREAVAANTGAAVAESGKAIAITKPNNRVTIDIFRNASSTKSVNIGADIMAAY